MATPTVSHPRPLTYDDYCLLPEDGKRHELIEGEFFVSPAPFIRHQSVSSNLLGALWSSLQTPGLARVFHAPTDLILARTTVVQPDLIIVGQARQAFITARAVEGPPDVVVEILSPSSLDRDQYIKRKLYEKFSIPEYWVVDPEQALVTVYRLDEGSYGIRARHERSSTLDCPEFPTLRVPLADVFR
jgi:Uma2 family endonuclease